MTRSPSSRQPSRSTASDPSPFTCLEDAFAALSADPRPLTFDGRTVDGLPDRAIAFTELRARMLHASTPYATRDAVLSALVHRAQRDGGAATIALAGMLLPGLRRAAWVLVRACPDRAVDVEADMLAGLLGALATVSARRPRLAGLLTGRAFDAAKSAVREELAERGRPLHTPRPAPPHRPFGHPEFVLGEAVLDGIITPDDAELIASTRLEGVSLKAAAYQRGLRYKTAAARRARAEEFVIAYVRAGSVVDDDGGGIERPENRPWRRDGEPVAVRSVETRQLENGPARAGSLVAEGPRQERRFDRRWELCPDSTDQPNPRR